MSGHLIGVRLTSEQSVTVSALFVTFHIPTSRSSSVLYPCQQLEFLAFKILAIVEIYCM